MTFSFSWVVAGGNPPPDDSEGDVTHATANR